MEMVNLGNRINEGLVEVTKNKKVSIIIVAKLAAQICEFISFAKTTKRSCF